MHPSSLSASPTPSRSSPPHPTSPPVKLEELTEEELREIYENEEIERFLHLFSTYVREVKASDATDATSGTSILSERLTAEEEWVLPNDETNIRATPKDHSPHYNCFSEAICQLLLPYLPPPRAPPQEFTINRFRLAAQRLYLAIVPHYSPLIARLYRLAKWQDREKSLLFCVGFWILWWNDLLLAASLFNLLLILLKRRLFPYPSLADLKRHREEVSHADQVGEQLSQRLSVASFGMRDLWRFGKILAFPPKEKTRTGKHGVHPQSQDYISPEMSGEPILEDARDSEDTKELKRLGLFLMNEIADLHERIKNLFIWRKPASSWFYFIVLTIMFFGALFLPSRYIMKAVLGTMGFLFWHATPVIVTLPPEDRLRLPPLLSNVPTDTEYAMEVISQRVVSGLEIKPSKFTKENKIPRRDAPTSPKANGTNGTNGRNSLTLKDRTENNYHKEKSGRWRRVGNAIDSGASLLQDGKRLLSKVQANQPRSGVFLSGYSEPPAVTYTFAAQHSSAPGLITFTPNILYFTPLTSLSPKISISVQDIKGVKKSGVLKGLDILWVETDPTGRRTEKLDKFTWIKNRDELFARVISANSGTKWTRT